MKNAKSVKSVKSANPAKLGGSSTLYAQPHNGGMAIYLEDQGETYFVMTHRKNNQLFFFLKEGRLLDEVRGYRPSRRKNEQALSHSLEYIVRVADYVLAEEAAWDAWEEQAA